MAEYADQLKGVIREITRNVDLEHITIKDVRKQAEEKLGITIEDKDSFAEIVKNVLREGDPAEASYEAPKKKSNRGNGLKTKKYVLSPALAGLLGVDMETRPGVVKGVWEYIKEKDLQSLEDKRKINLDETLENVFRVKVFTMFSMQKLISKHLKKEEDDTPFDTDPGDIDYSIIPKPDPEKKRKRKTTKDKKKKRRPPGPNAKPNGFTMPIRVTPLLSAFMGGEERYSRGDVVRALWAHIKGNDLQNPDNRKEILCDATLKEILEQDSCTGFSMNKYIQKHFIKPTPEEKAAASAEFAAKAAEAAAVAAAAEAAANEAGVEETYDQGEF